ncbi:STAS domain-containing protein [Streptomyces sp. KL2]|uniref:STAS domain-containing protein n=1 Tax=Streptomyces sp. KL2 TaxID=3050126 RepID=UPI00397B0AB1
MPDRDLTVTLRPHPAGPFLLEVSGELDHHTADRMREALNELPRDRGTAVVIDLSGLVYCDSSGITVLITAYHLTQSLGGSLALAGLDDDIMRVFGIVGLDQIFAFHDSVEEAVAALAG